MPDLADVFEVAPRTIDNWIANIPEFAKAVREGRAVADARVARSLYERAVGYQHTVEQTVLHRGEERKLTNTVQYPPDTGACIFWLRNRRRDVWGNRRPANDSAGPTTTWWRAGRCRRDGRALARGLSVSLASRKRGGPRRRRRGRELPRCGP